MGQMFRLTTLQDNTIATSLQYANGQITLNGKNATGRFRWYVCNAGIKRSGRTRYSAAVIHSQNAGGVSLRRYFLLQHKVILNTHFHIPVIQAMAQRTAIALFRPLSAARKKFIPCNGPSLTR